jgi:hypothetical protein
MKFYEIVPVAYKHYVVLVCEVDKEKVKRCKTFNYEDFKLYALGAISSLKIELISEYIEIKDKLYLTDQKEIRSFLLKLYDLDDCEKILKSIPDIKRESKKYNLKIDYHSFKELTTICEILLKLNNIYSKTLKRQSYDNQTHK